MAATGTCFEDEVGGEEDVGVGVVEGAVVMLMVGGCVVLVLLFWSVGID
jgi:hypothetical protein